MTIKQLFELVERIDCLEDEEFQALYAIIHIRATRRERRKGHPPKSPQGGELEDGDTTPET